MLHLRVQEFLARWWRSRHLGEEARHPDLDGNFTDYQPAWRAEMPDERQLSSVDHEIKSRFVWVT